METLERVNLEVYDSALAQQRRKLLADAGTILGYKPANPLSLISQLLTMGVIPFKADQVAAYKKSKESTSIWSGTRNWFIWMSINLFALVPCTLLWRWDNRMPTGKDEEAFVFAFCTTLVLLISVIAWLSNCKMIGHGNRICYEWSDASIERYFSIIPDHVLDVALKVKQQVPSAIFEIDYLVKKMVSNPRPIPAPDPFLTVRMSNSSERYWIEQWNEKDLPKLD